MKIIINDHRKIFGIQEEFCKMFPNLRIEFYSKPPHAHGNTDKPVIHPAHKTIGSCRIIHNKGMLTLTPHMTIAEIEQALGDVFGLSTMIYHKSGITWNELDRTDKSPLEELNKNVG